MLPFLIIGNHSNWNGIVNQKNDKQINDNNLRFIRTFLNIRTSFSSLKIIFNDSKGKSMKSQQMKNWTFFRTSCLRSNVLVVFFLSTTDTCEAYMWSIHVSSDSRLLNNANKDLNTAFFHELPWVFNAFLNYWSPVTAQIMISQFLKSQDRSLSIARCKTFRITWV